MSTSPAKNSLPLDEVMLAMDVVDTLRHRQDLVARTLDDDKREKQLIGKLRNIYSQQGIAVPDHILKEGVSALSESRFVYTAPEGGPGVFLARIYVARKAWGRLIFGAIFALVVAIASYQFAYLPWQAAQKEAARIELAEILPQQMDALFDSIFSDTKVQTAVTQAEGIRTRGKILASENDRNGALNAVQLLTDLRDLIRQDYSLRIVNREGVQSGFWTFPEINADATNYYVVVEAIDANGSVMTLPIVNEENDTIEKVDMWGLRVPEEVYNSVAADKRDDGIIQRNIVGRKQYGFVVIDFVVPVLGGTVTRW